MTGVLIDTNIPLNVWLHDVSAPRPMSIVSASVLAAAANGAIQAFMTPTIFTNAFYLAHRTLGKRKAIALGNDLLDIAQVIGQDGNVLRKALNAGWKDAMQYHAAIADPGISMICTTNARHFKLAKGIKVYTPVQLSAMLRSA